MLSAVLDGEHPYRGVVHHPAAESRRFVEPRVALLLNHLRSIGDGPLHELDDVGLGLELLTRRIVALAEVGPDIRSGNRAYQNVIQRGSVEKVPFFLRKAWPQQRRFISNNQCRHREDQKKCSGHRRSDA